MGKKEAVGREGRSGMRIKEGEEMVGREHKRTNEFSGYRDNRDCCDCR